MICPIFITCTNFTPSSHWVVEVDCFLVLNISSMSLLTALKILHFYCVKVFCALFWNHSILSWVNGSWRYSDSDRIQTLEFMNFPLLSLCEILGASNILNILNNSLVISACFDVTGRSCSIFFNLSRYTIIYLRYLDCWLYISFITYLLELWSPFHWISLALSILLFWVLIPTIYNWVNLFYFILNLGSIILL